MIAYCRQDYSTAKATHAGITQPPAPAHPIARGRAGPVLLAEIAFGKFGPASSDPFLLLDGVSLVAAPSAMSTVPEASTWAMMLLGFGGLGLPAYCKVRDADANSNERQDLRRTGCDKVFVHGTKPQSGTITRGVVKALFLDLDRPHANRG